MRIENKVPGFEYAPTLGWLIFIVCPAIYQYGYLDPGFRAEYMLIIIIICIGFLVADWYSLRVIKSNQGSKYVDSISRYSMYSIVAISVLVMLFNLYQIRDLPLLSLFTDKNVDLSDQRYLATKGLEVPVVIKYLYNWSLVVFAPLAIVLGVRSQRAWLSIALIVFSGFYAVATSAKFPLAQLLVLVIAGLISTATVQDRTRWYRTFIYVGVLSIFSLFIASQSFRSNLVENDEIIREGRLGLLQRFSSDDPRSTLTLGDMQRLIPESKNSLGFIEKTEKIINYLFYRSFLTPVDVSIRWYEYYKTQAAPEGLMSIFLSRGGSADSPSRIVGLWAYRDRFPDHYKAYINAYASFDADAYARYGLVGVFLATLLLLAIRLIGAICFRCTLFSRSLYGLLVGGLFLLPASASIQAMLGAQGLMVVIVLMMINLAFSVLRIRKT